MAGLMLVLVCSTIGKCLYPFLRLLEFGDAVVLAASNAAEAAAAMAADDAAFDPLVLAAAWEFRVPLGIVFVNFFRSLSQ